MAVATFSQSVLPMVVAREKSYFREEDLDVELILMTASVGNMALLGGNVDFISSGPSRRRRYCPWGATQICVYLFQPADARVVRETVDKRPNRTQGKEDRCQRGRLEQSLSRSRDLKAARVGPRSRRRHPRCRNHGEPLSGITKRRHRCNDLTPPFNFRAQESGFRELVAFVKEDYLVEPAGAIVVRESLFQSDA
jgi:hypothetical protein